MHKSYVIKPYYCFSIHQGSQGLMFVAVIFCRHIDIFPGNFLDCPLLPQNKLTGTTEKLLSWYCRKLISGAKLDPPINSQNCIDVVVLYKCICSYLSISTEKK